MKRKIRLLKEDKHEEGEAIKTYGKRKKQIPELKSKYSEMQSDEKDHLKKLKHAIDTAPSFMKRKKR